MNILTILFSFFLFSSNVWATGVPNLSSPIVDKAGLLSPRVKTALRSALFDLKKQTGNEIAVLTINSLESEPIESYSLRVAEQWKLGSEKSDNGILFLISVQDRKMRIEVGQGLEGVIPDITAGRIINKVRYYFKRGDFESGIIVGLSQISEKLGRKLTNAPSIRNKRSGRSSGSFIMIIIFILISIFGRGSRGGRALLVGGLLGSSSRGSFGRSGRSFGSGGGFSGGGASGGW